VSPARDRSNQPYTVVPILKRVGVRVNGKWTTTVIRKIIVLSPARQAIKLYRRTMGADGRPMSGRQWVKARKAMRRAAKAEPTSLVRE
jgi:hypothetical protein